MVKFYISCNQRFVQLLVSNALKNPFFCLESSGPLDFVGSVEDNLEAAPCERVLLNVLCCSADVDETGANLSVFPGHSSADIAFEDPTLTGLDLRLGLVASGLSVSRAELSAASST